MRIYLAGPMTGLPDYNFPAFHEAAAAWEARGYQVLNPATHFGGDTTRDYAEYMRVSIEDVLAADALALLPGWTLSQGACLEYCIALLLGLPRYDALTFEPVYHTRGVVGADIYKSSPYPLLPWPLKDKADAL